MRNLAPAKMEDDILQTLWLQRLPANLQQILSVCKASLDELAQIADKIHEVSGCNLTVARVESNSDKFELDAIKAELSDLKNMVKKLSVSQYSHGLIKPRRRSRTPSRLIADKNVEPKRLFDSGAAVCCYPKKLTNFKAKQDLELYAANGSRISTYGTIKLELDFGLRRSFIWSFLVADVSDPIIGADFLERFELLIDVRNRRLLDGRTSLFVKGTLKQTNSLGLTLVVNNSPFHSILLKYPNLFSTNLDPNTNKSTVTHCIETKGPPVHARARRLNPEKLTFLKQEFNDLMRRGIIRPSKSSYSSPIHFVKKSNGSWRICGDFRRLNSVTTPDRYPLPHIHDFVNGLRGKTVFSKIDLVKAYHQIPMNPRDIHKTAVITPIGLFEYVFMTFGLRNAAQTMQRYIDSIIRDIPSCYAYVDDLLIASVDQESHKSDLDLVFSKLSEHGIVVNPQKCVFGQSELKFLGFLVSSTGISPLPEKVQFLQEFPLPKTVQELRRFLATLNFYHRFLKDAAKEQACLHGLVKNKVKKDNTPIAWTEDTRSAFESCKRLIANSTALSSPAADARLSLMTDASDFAVGAVLQQHIESKVEPLGFFSRKLSATEQKYSTFDRELLSIYLSVKHFRYMLEGREVVIYTDHKPLVFAFTRKHDNSTPRQIRYLELISQFTTDIRYIAGRNNVVADTFSRISQIDLLNLNDFSGLADDQFSDPELQSLMGSGTGLELRPMYFASSEKPLYCDVSTGTVRPYVTKSFRRQIFNQIHNLSHPGVKATQKLVATRFVWKNMNKDCALWCRNCIQCQKSKVARHTKSVVGHFPLPSARFSHVHIDVVGPLSPVRGMTYLLTCVDRFTRWPEAFPIPDQSADTIARTFLLGWISRFGVPEKVTSDRGTNFQSNLFSSLSKFLGVEQTRTTAYHPQSNGAVERFHRHLKSALMAHLPENWLDSLPLVLLGIRSSFKPDLATSSAELVYGTTLKLPGEFFSNPPVITSASSFLQMLRHHVRSFRPVPTKHHCSDAVFISDDLIKASHVFFRIDRVRKSLEPPYAGPYKVLSRTEKVFTVQINGKPTSVSIDRLKAAHLFLDDFPSRSSPPVPASKAQRSEVVTRSGRHSRRVVHFQASPFS
ncbi:Transposon Ty3-I Gag-Pol polyprotein [Araneus ventricosus]|uniref:RNA-directed DNA polymerase n=1 Tax=Araneus ventricosus TaxID=182803 RepID=A0A4Y2LFE8_ARAVE|nr:Transposon Ty3-I Gag-Pol polyprotein [Araneus ventricosus]